MKLPSEKNDDKRKGFQYVNDEQKIRVSLSRHAYTVMLSDMNIFGIPLQANFINRVIKDFRDSAHASISMHLYHKRMEYEELFSSSELLPALRSEVIDHLITYEGQKITREVSLLLQNKDVTKVYHISNDNMEFLTQEFEDVEFYRQRPGLYIKALIEEYSYFSFIEREKIMLKNKYEVIESACANRELLQIKAGDPPQYFTVYPYKIIPDPLNVQDYLVCFSQREDGSPKIEASFSMLRILKAKKYRRNAFLSKAEISQLENSISQKSVAFFIGDSEKIIVRLTPLGKQWYQRRLYNRPEVTEVNAKDDEYMFYCPEWQALMYFLPFGENAEVIHPSPLRAKIKAIYDKASLAYH